jgi:dTDP-L-rhamnose 4-epimerase
MSLRHILVTGGAGYIGSHLVDALVAREYQVTVLDVLEPQVHRTGRWPSYANPKAHYVQGDVRDRAVFEPLVLAADGVVHFAAAVGVGQSMYQVDRYVDVNTRGTSVLLDILVNAKHHVEKLLVASSIGVYGEGAYSCAVHGPVAPGIRPAEQLASHDWEQRCPVCREHVTSARPTASRPWRRDSSTSTARGRA